ncbi:hypothetical protein EVA_08163, partial [gut metagenome]
SVLREHTDDAAAADRLFEEFQAMFAEIKENVRQQHDADMPSPTPLKEA